MSSRQGTGLVEFPGAAGFGFQQVSGAGCRVWGGQRAFDRQNLRSVSFLLSCYPKRNRMQYNTGVDSRPRGAWALRRQTGRGGIICRSPPLARLCYGLGERLCRRAGWL
jgi:hypothetical protein